MCQFRCFSNFPLLSLPVTVEQSFPMITLPTTSTCVSAMGLGIRRLHEPQFPRPPVAICSTVSFIWKNEWQCVCVWLGAIFVCVMELGEKLWKCSQSTCSLPCKCGASLVPFIFQKGSNKRLSEDTSILWLRKSHLNSGWRIEVRDFEKGFDFNFLPPDPCHIWTKWCDHHVTWTLKWSKC